MTEKIKKLIGAIPLPVVFAFAFFVVGIFEIVFLAKYGNTPQVYTDIVLEELGFEMANKSVEFILYVLGTLIGLGILASYFILKKDKSPLREENWNQLTLIAIVFGCAILGLYVFYGYVQSVLVLALFSAFCYHLRGRDASYGILIFFMGLYGFSALYRILAFFGRFEANLMLMSVIAFFIAFLFCFLPEKWSQKFILFLQIPIPFLFLLFLMKEYKFQGNTMELKPKLTVYLFVFAVIFVSLILVVKKILSEWRDFKISSSISIASSIAAMCFQRYSGAPFMMVSDMHHPAENTISFNEVVNHGLALFKDYSPISGLYSFIQGFFLEVFGSGNYIEYSIANNIYYSVIIMLTVFAVRLHLNSFWTFVFSVLVLVTDYSRVALILPFMLILLSRQLLRHKNVWFTVWVLFSLFYGLYYPAYGAAVALSLMPLALILFRKIKSEWKEKSSAYKIFSLCLWGLTLLICAAFIPVLAGLAKHVIAMGDSMIYVDGVTIFGQALPRDFLSFLNTKNILHTSRLCLGYVVRFSVPMAVIYVSFATFTQEATRMRNRLKLYGGGGIK